MKLCFTYLLAALLLPAATLLAPARPAYPAATSQHNSSAEQRADRMSQEVAQRLGLDAGTTAKVRAAALTRFQKIDAAYKNLANTVERNQALDASTREFLAALQRILTPAQYTQYMHPSPKPADKPSKPKGQRID